MKAMMKAIKNATMFAMVCVLFLCASCQKNCTGPVSVWNGTAVVQEVVPIDCNTGIPIGMSVYSGGGTGGGTTYTGGGNTSQPGNSGTGTSAGTLVSMDAYASNWMSGTNGCAYTSPVMLIQCASSQSVAGAFGNQVPDDSYVAIGVMYNGSIQTALLTKNIYNQIMIGAVFDAIRGLWRQGNGNQYVAFNCISNTDGSQVGATYYSQTTDGCGNTIYQPAGTAIYLKISNYQLIN